MTLVDNPKRVFKHFEHGLWSTWCILAGLGRTNDLSHTDAVLEFECGRRNYWIGGFEY